MDIEIEPAAVIPATVEDELMEYEDDAAIDVDEPVAPADGSAEASGEEDTEMSDELESATVVELEMREPVPDVEVVIAPEVVLADAEGQDGGVEEESPDVAVEEPVAVQVSLVEADEAQAIADAALEEEHVEDGAEGEPDVEADEAVVATEISPEEAAGASTEAPPAEPHEPMGNEFFEYGLHDGSGDEAVHASGSDYYEEEGDSDSIPPIILHLPSSQQRSLFSATTEDGVVLLEGRADDLCHVSLVELLDALRGELGADDATESELEAGEMVLEEAEMGLRVGEDNYHAHHITLAQLLDLHRGCQIPEPVQLYLSFEPEEDRFITRFRAIEREVLAQAARAGLEADEVDELEGHDVEDESPVAEKHEQVSVPLPAEEDQHVDDASEEQQLAAETGVNAPGEGDSQTEAHAEVGEQDDLDAGVEVIGDEVTHSPDAATADEQEEAHVGTIADHAINEAHSETVQIEEVAPGAPDLDAAEPVVQDAPSANEVSEIAEAVEAGAGAAAEATEEHGEDYAEGYEHVAESVDQETVEIVEGDAAELQGDVEDNEDAAEGAILLEEVNEVTDAAPAEDVNFAVPEIAEADESGEISQAEVATAPAADTAEPQVDASVEAGFNDVDDTVHESAGDGDDLSDDDDQFGIDAVVNAAERNAEDDDAQLDFAGGEIDDEELVGRVEEATEGAEFPDVHDEADEIASQGSSRTISADGDGDGVADDNDPALALAHSMLPIEESTWAEDDVQEDDYYDPENEAEWRDDVDGDAGSVQVVEPAPVGFIPATGLVETLSRSPKRPLDEGDDGKAEREVRQKR